MGRHINRNTVADMVMDSDSSFVATYCPKGK